MKSRTGNTMQFSNKLKCLPVWQLLIDLFLGFRFKCELLLCTWQGSLVGLVDYPDDEDDDEEEETSPRKRPRLGS